LLVGLSLQSLGRIEPASVLLCSHVSGNLAQLLRVVDVDLDVVGLNTRRALVIVEVVLVLSQHAIGSNFSLGRVLPEDLMGVMGHIDRLVLNFLR
jgi:hypothetical protein